MNNVALITGASRGIGLEISWYFAQRGYDLILVARDSAKLASLAHDIKSKHNVSCTSIAVDICDTELMTSELERAIHNHGRIDTLVNCAGIFLDDDIDHTTDNLSAMLNTNILAVQKISNLCIPMMITRKAGYIFNIASVAGVKPYKGISDYSASKHALVGYSLCLSKSLKEHSIKVTVICPDVVDTDMSASTTLSAEQKIQPSDIAKSIDFIMSLSASASVDQLSIGR